MEQPLQGGLAFPWNKSRPGPVHVALLFEGGEAGVFLFTGCAWGRGADGKGEEWRRNQGLDACPKAGGEARPGKRDSPDGFSWNRLWGLGKVKPVSQSCSSCPADSPAGTRLHTDELFFSRVSSASGLSRFCFSMCQMGFPSPSN